MIYRTLKFLPLLIFLNGCFGGGETTTTTTTSSGGSSGSSNSTTSGLTSLYRWTSQLPDSGLVLVVGDALEAEFSAGDYDSNSYDPIEQSMEKWNNSGTNKTLFALPANSTSNKAYTNTDSYGSDDEMGVYKHSDWFSNISSTALAITQFFGIQRNVGTDSYYVELTHADIIFNYKNFTFSTDANDTVNYDFHSVIIHELGHFVGLQHVSNQSSVMVAFLGQSSSSRTLTSYDQSVAVATYGSSSSLTAAQTAGVVAGFSSTAGSSIGPNNSQSGPDGDYVKGIVELRADGECRHYINGELVHSHQAHSDLKRRHHL